MTSTRQFIGAMAFASSMLFVATWARTAQAQMVEWDIDAAIAAGSGCNAQGPFPDTFFSTAGDDVSVIFTRMGVDLTPASAENTAVHACLIRIPIVLDEDVAISELTQAVEWGWAKDLNTEVEVHTSATFFGRATARIDRYLGMSLEGVEAFRTDEVTNTFFQPCTHRNHEGLYRLNMSIAGRRLNTSADLSVGIFGEDVKVNVAAVWVSC
jgi:hypothetical protein